MPDLRRRVCAASVGHEDSNEGDLTGVGALPMPHCHGCQCLARHRPSQVARAACLPRDVACTLIRRLPEHLSHDRQEAIAAGFKAEAFSSAIKSDVSSFIAKCIVIATCSGIGSDPALEQRGTEAVAPSGSQSGRARSSSRSAGCQHRRRSCSWLAEGERGSTTYAPRRFSKKKKQSGGMAGAMWSMSLTDTPQAKKSSRQCRTHRRVDRSPRASPADKPKRPACDRRFQVLLLDGSSRCHRRDPMRLCRAHQPDLTRR